MTKTILMYDTLDMIEGISRMLKTHPRLGKEAIDVAGANSEVEALEKFTAQKGKFDLVLIASGNAKDDFSFLEYIRKMGSKVPVVLRVIFLDRKEADKKLPHLSGDNSLTLKGDSPHELMNLIEQKLYGPIKSL